METDWKEVLAITTGLMVDADALDDLNWLAKWDYLDAIIILAMEGCASNHP